MLSLIALAVEYNGAAYHGWQRQKDPACDTVQGCVETALSYIANEAISVVCAGRTDARVHAMNQVIHFSTNNKRPLKAWVEGANTQLPRDIKILWAVSLQDLAFHARFTAQARSYRYIIHNVKVASAILQGLVTHVPFLLNEHAMHEAAQSLLGEQDFSSFRGASCQSNSPFRCVHSVRVHRHNDFVFVDIKANAFLLHMVRNIAGMLIAIGRGRSSVASMAEVLAAKDRSQADVTASPDGLYLVGVDYPDKYELPQTFKLPSIT